MALTKAQKVWLGLLAVAAGALAVDHFAGSDTPAVAAAPAESVATEAPARAAAPTSDLPGLSLADRLSALSATVKDTPRDAFTPAAAWTNTPTATQQQADEQAARFRQSHSLRAVLQTGDRGQALVDSTLVGVGQNFDGCKLLRIDGLHAVFAGPGGTIELSLPGATASTAKDPTP